MSDLILVTGPPGAGKSTVAARLAATFDRVVVVPGDAFFGFWARGAIMPWLPEADAQNEVITRAAAAATGAFVTGGVDVVYEGVVGPWFLPTFAAAAGLESLQYVVLLPSLDECLARVAGRPGHGFTDPDATRRMYAEFAEADLDPRHVLRDPPSDPMAVAHAVLDGVRSGTFLYRRPPAGPGPGDAPGTGGLPARGAAPPRVEAHVIAFNQAQRTGDWDAFADRFAAGATMRFVGVPAGPYAGREAIRESYERQPPTDTMTVRRVRSQGDADEVDFAWASGGTGTMRITWAGPLVADLEVAFDA